MRSLSQFFQEKQEKKELDEKTVLYITRNVIIREYGNKGGENIFPSVWREGRLILKVAGSIWENELLFQKEFLKKTINQECGKKIIKDIFIKR